VGLFDQVILESSAFIGESQPLNATLQYWAPVASALNCTTLECLRAASWEDVLTAQTSGALAAGHGNGILTFSNSSAVKSNPAALFLSGQFQKVPILAGNDKNEGTVFVLPLVDPVAQPVYLKTLEAQAARLPGVKPEQFAQIVSQQYPCNATTGDCYPSLINVVGDYALVCPTNLILASQAAAGQPAFAFEFDYQPEWAPPFLGVFHSSEIDFAFDTIMYRKVYRPEGVLLAKWMSAAWVSFAQTGSPASTNTAWPTYSAAAPQRLQIRADEKSVLTTWREDKCPFWAKFF
jgi:para-nitrobenzyl esterase